MNTKFFVFITLVFVSLVSAINIPGDNSQCDLEMSEACKQNTRFVTLRRLKPDFSVAFSQYMTINNLTFAEKYTMTELNYNGVAPEPEEHEVPEEIVFSHVDSDEFLLGALTTPLEAYTDDENDSANYYVVYAAIDLMNYAFRFQDKNETVKWRFSAKQLIREKREEHLSTDGIRMKDYNNIREIMDYLQTKGVCKEEEYDNNEASCERYRIDGYEYLWQNATNQWILDNLVNEPLYVQVGIHPLYYQFYTPLCEEPIHAGYIKPNLAGVLTGYDFQTLGQESWEMYIRRHGGGENNKVKLGCMFEKNGIPQPPAAGIVSKIYRIEKGEDLSPVGRAKLTADKVKTEIKTTKDFEKVFTEVLLTEEKQAEELVIDTNIFNCEGTANNSINITDILTKAGTKTLIMDGNNNFDCVHMDELEVDYVETDDEEEGEEESGRRLAPSSEPKRFENKRFLSITIGKRKYKKQNLYIKNCPLLTLVSIGEGSFSEGSEFVLERNPLLMTLIVHKGAFGSGKIDESSVTLSDLPLLEFMYLDEGAFDNILNVKAKDVHPVYLFNMVISGKDAFRNLDDFEGEFDNNHPSLVNYFVGKRKTTPTTTGPSSEPNL